MVFDYMMNIRYCTVTVILVIPGLFFMFKTVKV